MPRTRLRRAPSTQPGTPAPALAPSADVPAAIPLEPPRHPLERAEEVRVAVVIAMPHPHRSAYVAPAADAAARRATELMGLPGKGKARELDGWGEDAHEEEGVPDVVFGVAHIPILDELDLSEGRKPDA